MKNNNQQFEETGAFLDLMSKKERKQWEKEQSKNKKDKKDEEKYLEEQKNVIQKKDNSSKQKKDSSNDEEVVKTTPKVFSPIPPLGIVLMILFALFTYLVIFSKYTNNTFLIINCIILLSLTFAFGLTVLSNRKHVKLFVIIDWLIILVIIIFNTISITSYENIYNQLEAKKVKPSENKIQTNKPVPEKVNHNEYICSNDEQTISLNIKEENGYITHLKKVETLANDKLAEETSVFYEDKDGIKVAVAGPIITIEFDFLKLDINQYKLAITSHNDYYRLESDFSYIINDKINYKKYTDIELKSLNCTKVENTQ